MQDSFRSSQAWNDNSWIQPKWSSLCKSFITNMPNKSLNLNRFGLVWFMLWDYFKHFGALIEQHWLYIWPSGSFLVRMLLLLPWFGNSKPLDCRLFCSTTWSLYAGRLTCYVLHVCKADGRIALHWQNLSTTSSLQATYWPEIVVASSTETKALKQHLLHNITLKLWTTV